MRTAVSLTVLVLLATAPAARASRIVFASAESVDAARAGHTHLYTMSPSGGGRHVISDGSGADFQPAASPNGRKVAYIHYKSIHRQARSLWVRSIGGGGAHRILSGPQDASLTWTPDGKWIVFGVGQRIDAVHPDGSGRHTLFKPSQDAEPYYASNPTVSGDGSLLAFDDGGGAVWTMPADGSAAPSKLAAGGSSPAFAPRGRRVVYMSNTGLCVATIGISGKKCFRGTRGGGFGIDPSWSPDGKRIVFNRGYLPHPYQELSVLTVATGKQKRITHDFVDEIQASWAP